MDNTNANAPEVFQYFDPRVKQYISIRKITTGAQVQWQRENITQMRVADFINGKISTMINMLKGINECFVEDGDLEVSSDISDESFGDKYEQSVMILGWQNINQDEVDAFFAAKRNLD